MKAGQKLTVKGKEPQQSLKKKKRVEKETYGVCGEWAEHEKEGKASFTKAPRKKLKRTTIKKTKAGKL